MTFPLRSMLGLTLAAGAAIACGDESGNDTLDAAFQGDAAVTQDAAFQADAGVTRDAGGQPAPGCAAPTGPGTTHSGEINADETWTATASPHVVTFDLSLHAGQLTIEPCAVVRIQPGYTILIDGQTGTATLSAHGEAIRNSDGSMTIRPVTFIPDTPGTFWGSLVVRSSGMLDLEQVNLRNGGAQANLGTTILATGENGQVLSHNVRTVSVLIEDSEGFGVDLQSAGAFTEDSRDLTIKGAGQNPSISAFVTDYPLFVSPPAIHTIPRGTYTGNKIDAVEVNPAGAANVDEGFRNVGIPYHLGGSFSMGPPETVAQGGLITLTIEAGVTLQMGPETSLVLGGSNGGLPENIWPVRLVAVGTPTSPIVLTSASTAAAAGDWVGIEWHGGPATGNQLSDVRIEYAGAHSGNVGFGCGPGANDAALIITNWRPDEDFIDRLTVSDSENGGIVSGWISDQDGPNFKTGNTFLRLGNDCEVSRWMNVSLPACPGNDNIPDCL